MTYDFLIIGGGVAGVSAGARLSDLGRTLVLEAETALAYHASGRSAALYEAKYGLPPTIALNLASFEHHDRTGVLSPRGFLLVAAEHEADGFETDLALMDLTEITAVEAQALIPIIDTGHVARAAHATGASDIDTDKLVQDFAREVRANGGQVKTAARVTEITRADGLWTVIAGSDVYTARTLVNAAGAWADEIAKLAGIAPIGLTPLRRSVARMPAPGGQDVSGWPMLFGTGESWYAKPDAGAWIVSPAEEDPVDAPHDAYADDMVLAEGIARYQPFVTEEVTRVTSSWAGLRTFAPDRTLVLGPDPTQHDFVWVAGQGGYGMQTSPAASQLVADLIAGRQPQIDAGTVAALSPARFR